MKSMERNLIMAAQRSLLAMCPEVTGYQESMSWTKYNESLKDLRTTLKEIEEYLEIMSADKR